MSASQMIVSAESPRPLAMLARIAVALRVSALGRNVVANELRPLRKMGIASEAAVSDGTVRNRPESVARPVARGLAEKVDNRALRW